MMPKRLEAARSVRLFLRLLSQIWRFDPARTVIGDLPARFQASAQRVCEDEVPSRGGLVAAVTLATKVRPFSLLLRLRTPQICLAKARLLADNWRKDFGDPMINVGVEAVPGLPPAGHIWVTVDDRYLWRVDRSQSRRFPVLIGEKAGIRYWWRQPDSAANTPPDTRKTSRSW